MPTVNYPSHVEIVEVGPRDGLQNEPILVSTQDKVALINALGESGIRRIQVTSFVHPKLVPQMADAEKVCKQITRYPGIIYSGLALNVKGVERAAQAGIEVIDISISASDEHGRRNANVGLDEALGTFAGMYERARESGMTVRGGIQCAFGFRQPDDVDPAAVIRIAEAYVKMGIDELAIADSSGMATPRQITELLEPILPIAGDIPVVMHLHNTRGLGLANVHAALQMGVRIFDTAIGGMGGCPFIDGAKGNIATEDTVYMLERMGIETGVNLHALAQITRRLEKLVDEHSLSSLLYPLVLQDPAVSAESV